MEAHATTKTSEAKGNEDCMFWKLPPELRDRIYEFAYSSEQPFRVRLIRLPFCLREAASAVERFMVSKQYFTEAIPIFAEYNHFRFTHPEDLDTFVNMGLSSLRSNVRSIRIVNAEIFDFLACQHASLLLPKLTNLLIVMKSVAKILNKGSSWDPEDSPVEPVDCDRAPAIQSLSEFRGIEHFNLVDLYLGELRDVSHVFHLADRVQAEDNAKQAVGEYNRARIRKPRIA